MLFNYHGYLISDADARKFHEQLSLETEVKKIRYALQERDKALLATQASLDKYGVPGNAF